MALQRQVNFLGQMRIDVPHLRMLESAVAADFDVLAGMGMAGGKALILRGFEVVTASAIGAAATSLQIAVANSVMLHPLASEAGSVYAVGSTAAVETLSISNDKVIGSFVANTTNYVGVDLIREEDDASADLVMFLNALTWAETPRTVPLARSLEFRIVISTVEFSATPNIAPVCKIVTGASAEVVSIEDARQLMFRLAPGGTNVQRTNSFAWAGTRSEGAFVGDLLGSTADSFTSGDKAIKSLKDSLDALMTRLWEIGGGERWFSVTSDREAKLCFGAPTLGNGDNFLWTLGSSTLQWTSLSFCFANSTAITNVITNGSIVLADGECAYVDVRRDTDGATIAMQKAVRSTLGGPTIPGSRYIVAWRRGTEVFIRDKQYEAGRTYANAATDAALGLVKLYTGAVPLDAANPRVVPLDANGCMTHAPTSGANVTAIQGTGRGTGQGLFGLTIGSDYGVKGDGGANGAGGVLGLGAAVAGGSWGVRGVGGIQGKAGLRGEGGGANADGVEGVPNGTGAAFNAVSGDYIHTASGGTDKTNTTVGGVAARMTAVGGQFVRANQQGLNAAFGGECSRIIAGGHFQYDGTTARLKPGTFRFANGTVLTLTADTTFNPGSSGTGPQYIYLQNTATPGLVVSTTAPNARGTQGTLGTNTDMVYVGSIFAISGNDSECRVTTLSHGVRYVSLNISVGTETSADVAVLGNEAITRQTTGTINLTAAGNQAGASRLTTRTYLPTASVLRWSLFMFWTPNTGATAPTNTQATTIFTCADGGLRLMWQMPVAGTLWQAFDNGTTKPSFVVPVTQTWTFDMINFDDASGPRITFTRPAGWEYLFNSRCMGYIEDVNNPRPWL